MSSGCNKCFISAKVWPVVMKSSKAVMFGSFGKIFSSKSEPQNEPQSIVEKDLLLMPVWIRKIVTAAYARSLDNNYNHLRQKGDKAKHALRLFSIHVFLSYPIFICLLFNDFSNPPEQLV